MKRGVIVLHRPGSAAFGVVLEDVIRFANEGHVAYVLPSQKLVPRALRRLAQESTDLQKRVDVRTFDRFVRSLARSSKTLLTSEQQKLTVLMAVERAAKKQPFSYFRDSLTHTGWLRAIEEWIGEMKRAAVTVEQLRELWSNGTQKQKELFMIFSTYQELLAAMGLVDHEEEYLEMIDWLKNTENHVQDVPKRVVLEHFYDLNQLQAHALQVLAERGVEIYFHVEYDGTRKHVFTEAHRTIDILQSIGFDVENERNVQVQSLRTADLQFLIDRFYVPDFSVQQRNGKSVEIVESSSRLREVEAVAARIKTFVREQGYSLQEIGIVVANMEEYEDVLLSVMERAGIPLFFAKKQRLNENTLIQSVLQFLRVRIEHPKDFTHMWLSPYFPWGEKSGELLEIYRALGKPSSAEEWQIRVEQLIKSHLDSGNLEEEKRIRQLFSQGLWLYQLLEQIPEAATVDQFAVMIRNLEELGGFHQGFRRLLEDEDERAFLLVTRDMKALVALHEVMDEIGNLAAMAGEADKEIPLSEYVRRLQLSCENKEFAYQSGVKGGVHIVHPNHIRGQMWRAVFAIGMLEGEFPRAVKNDWLLPDEERYDLEQAHIRLWSSRDLYNGQSYRFYMTAASAREKLILSYPSTGSNGKERLRSTFVEEVLRLFDKESVKFHSIAISDVVPQSYGECVTMERFTEKVIADISSCPDQPTLALFRYRPLRERLRNLYPRIQVEWERRGREFGAFDGVLQSAHVKQRVQEMFAHHVWSASQLETLMQCRFAFFAERLLHLSSWEEEDDAMSPMEQGNLLHMILFRFMREKKGIVWQTHEKESLLQELLARAKMEINKYRETHALQRRNPVLWQIDEERLLLQLRRFFDVEWKRRESERMGLSPDLLEISFGMPVDVENADERSRKESISLTFGDQTIRMRGKIDRVDTSPDGHFVVYDYKKGTAPVSQQVREGIYIQLPLYLWVLEKGFGFDLAKAQGAAYFTQNDRNQGFWRKESLKELGIHHSVSSKIEQSEWEDVMKTIEQRIANTLQLAMQGNFAVVPAIECPSYCRFRHVCRFSEERLQTRND
ncbi:hypothetical protein DNHGIG_30590 [Collibacillus ludicampi]|uniref:DNA helicase n=1 Tax=Collibacillus ludicampi TaxID=2771369 RepID=A0AAV4LIA5_9BACL|nr:PD-(D/E)XK nuclease family protein [Collibacillus ludicampi]GIM47510.1 hypothetical protein DNHGIG_30590 [Collibacillus ludicampi]